MSVLLEKKTENPSSPLNQFPRTSDRMSAAAGIAEENTKTIDEEPKPLQELSNGDIAVLPALSRTRKVILGGVMISTYFLSSATQSSSILIIPSMSRDLQIPELSAQWVASAATLANGCGLLVCGRLADIYGRKYLFVFGLLINTITCIGAGFIRNLIALCVVRALSGLGLALAMPSAFGIVAVTFPVEPERTVAFAVMGLGYPLGAALGQVFGGLIAGVGGRSWQYQFFLLAGLGLFASAIGLIVIPPEVNSNTVTDKRVDWIGAVLITTALCMFSFSLTQSGLVGGGWTQAYIPTLFAISLSLVIVFGFWERYLKRKTTLKPLVDLAIFSRHQWKVLWVILTVLCAYLAISGWVYMTAIWYQTYKGETPIQNVLHVLTAPIVGVGVCILVPILAPRVRAPLLLMFGGFSTAAACWLFAIEPIGTNYWACEFIANIVNPFGADFTMGIGSILISNLAEGHEQSLLGAIFQTSIQLSATIGVCLSSLVQQVVHDRTGNLHQALVYAWWMLAGFAWLSCVIVLLTLRHVGLAKDVAKSS